MIVFRSIYLFAKSLRRIAVSLEELVSLYRMDLAARGITETNPTVQDRVEVMYGYQEEERQN
jgi:hypothetical protein